jgi:K+ transporter
VSHAARYGGTSSASIISAIKLATDFFRIPPNRVIELGSQAEI